VQNNVLIIANEKLICIRLANAFNLKIKQTTFLCDNSIGNLYKLNGSRFDTIIVHESFINFVSGEHLLKQLRYYMRPTSKIFHVQEEVHDYVK